MNNNFIGIVLSSNEELNIEKCLKNLKFLNKVYLIDSYSSDKTVCLARKFSNVQIIRVSNKFDYVDKINFVKRYFSSKWILILDSDYELSLKTYKYLLNLKPSENISGYKFNIQNIENRTILKTNLFPEKNLLIKTNLLRVEKNGHKEKIKIFGKIIKPNLLVYHNDKKKFKFWFKNQVNYAYKDAKLIKNLKVNLRVQDKIRRYPFVMNFISLFYYLFYKKLFMYGWPGIKYVLKRQPYEFLLSSFIIYFKIKKIFYYRWFLVIF